MSTSSAPAALRGAGGLSESDPGRALSTLAPVAATPGIVAGAALGVALVNAFVAGYNHGGGNVELPM
ncbi:hypothetical protein [Streptomyces sp. CA-256286]|uniref:hypothetical protein n=1 Tax=Streptomyces sp. CA-256286 TaxID=2801033 RepID=UPI001A99809B|nr:hypothetical protein [Streptomyces sp. CA-256286]QTA36054.1 hypothetical protein JHY03_62680 [Streptomyces sp. CA-256286]